MTKATRFPVGGSRDAVYAFFRQHGFQCDGHDKRWKRDDLRAHLYGSGSRVRIYRGEDLVIDTDLESGLEAVKAADLGESQTMNDMKLKLVKKALIRDPRVPEGKPADLFIQCCGNLVPQAMPPLIAGTVCPDCGTVYDVRGFIIGENRKLF